MRLLITGASGSGTTTLGQALARELEIAFFDADDYYWLPTDPPFREKRDRNVRLALLLADLCRVPQAVVSGSIVNWGAELEDSFSLIVFLSLDAKTRVARLREREIERFGEVDAKFLEWAAQYDEGGMEGRSRTLHEEWLSACPCPVLRIDGDCLVTEKIERVRNAMETIAAKNEI
jgi:adenylate kinase family enzyme